MSWPIILPFVAIGFVLGALWMRRHTRLASDPQEIQVGSAVARALRITDSVDIDTTYRYGRRPPERVTR